MTADDNAGGVDAEPVGVAAEPADRGLHVVLGPENGFAGDGGDGPVVDRHGNLTRVRQSSRDGRGQASSLVEGRPVHQPVAWNVGGMVRIDGDRRLTFVPVEERGNLAARHVVIGRERRRARAGGDVVVHHPCDGADRPWSDDIREAPRSHRWAAGEPEHERGKLRPREITIGAVGGRRCPGSDLLRLHPRHRLVLVARDDVEKAVVR